jgi:hypothetical protein
MEIDARIADELGVEDASGDQTTTVVLVVDNESGVRRFEAGLTAPKDVAVARVAAGDLDDTFEITAGGKGESLAEARAIDFVGKGSEPPVVLLGVRFSEPVDPSGVGFTARRLVDHEEGEVDGAAVQVAAAERTERL